MVGGANAEPDRRSRHPSGRQSQTVLALVIAHFVLHDTFVALACVVLAIRVHFVAWQSHDVGRPFRRMQL